MNSNQNVDFYIIVKDKQITEYAHRGQTYVEGREGSEYELEIKNKTSGRIEAIISVDGLSIIDGKTAGLSSSGYLLNAYETIRIPGWKVDSKVAAKFAFSGKKESYATQMSGGDSRNNGVIGLMAFAEKRKSAKHTYRTPSTPWNVGPFKPLPILRSNDQSYNPTTIEDDFEICGPGSSTGSIDDLKYFSNKLTKGLSVPRSYMSMSASASSTLNGNRRISTSGIAESISIEQQSLGTSFGEATKFSTITVEFERGDHLATLMIYYDNERGLKSRGIVMVKPSKTKYQTQPSAFPAMETGCPVPPNWKG